MPPAIEDEELDSDIDVPDAIPAKKRVAKAKEPETEDDDEEEEEEDEYQVDRILDHKTQAGKILYQIKWLGYDSDADLTWEPSENLSGAVEILNLYHISVGGTPKPEQKGKKATKRAASNTFDTPASEKKRGRKSDANGSNWQPPVGTWDDNVTHVAAIIESEDDVPSGKRTKSAAQLEGLLEWNNGKKTQHKMHLLRTKCPQRLLDYYEQHLLLKRLEEIAAADDAI